MKPILKDGKLIVKLSKLEMKQLAKAREIAAMLVALHQPVGDPAVEALDAILGEPADEAEG